MSSGQKLFDETFSEFSDHLAKFLEKNYKKNKALSDDEQFDLVTEPIMAAMLALSVEYCYQIGYTRGDMMERLWEFWNNAVENSEGDDNDSPDAEHSKSEKDIN